MGFVFFWLALFTKMKFESASTVVVSCWNYFWLVSTYIFVKLKKRVKLSRDNVCISDVGTLSEIAVSLTMTCSENYLPKIPALNLALEAAVWFNLKNTKTYQTICIFGKLWSKNHWKKNEITVTRVKLHAQVLGQNFQKLVIVGPSHHILKGKGCC